MWAQNSGNVLPDLTMTSYKPQFMPHWHESSSTYTKLTQDFFAAAMAEWLRRLTRNQMGFPRAGSNPARSGLVLNPRPLGQNMLRAQLQNWPKWLVVWQRQDRCGHKKLYFDTHNAVFKPYWLKYWLFFNIESHLRLLAMRKQNPPHESTPWMAWTVKSHFLWEL